MKESWHHTIEPFWVMVMVQRISILILNILLQQKNSITKGLDQIKMWFWYRDLPEKLHCVHLSCFWRRTTAWMTCCIVHKGPAFFWVFSFPCWASVLRFASIIAEHFQLYNLFVVFSFVVLGKGSNEAEVLSTERADEYIHSCVSSGYFFIPCTCLIF